MKIRIFAASAAALLCATGVAMAQDNPAAPPAPAGSSGTLCSTLNAISPDMKSAFLQGYSAGWMDMNGGGGTPVDNATVGAIGAANNGETNPANGAANAVPPPPLAPAAPGAMAPAAPATPAAGDLAANSAVTNGGPAPAAGTAVGTDMDWSTVIASCTGAPTSPISGFLSGVGASPAPATPMAPAN